MPQVILTSSFSATGRGWWSNHLSAVHFIPRFLSTTPSVPAVPPSHGASYTLSGQASCIHSFQCPQSVPPAALHTVHSFVRSFTMLYCFSEVSTQSTQLFGLPNPVGICVAFRRFFIFLRVGKSLACHSPA